MTFAFIPDQKVEKAAGGDPVMRRIERPLKEGEGHIDTLRRALRRAEAGQHKAAIALACEAVNEMASKFGIHGYASY